MSQQIRQESSANLGHLILGCPILGSNLGHPIQSHQVQAPKRPYSNYEKSVLLEDSYPQEPESQASKMRISHEILFKKLMQKKEQILLEENLQHQQASSTAVNPDLYLTTTEEESGLNSSLSSIQKSEVEDSESFKLDYDSENVDQNEEQSQKEEEEDSRQEVLETQQESSSVLFIPFQKTEDDLEWQRERQEYLLRQYTPLQYHEILPWMNEEIQAIEDTLLRLHEEIRAFYTYIRPSKKETEIRMQVFNHVKQVITGMYPTAEVHPFGSFATKLYLPDGDIDIVALIEHETRDIEGTKELYKAIYEEFRRNHRQTYSQIKYIASAKTPLVKMVHRQTGFPIDVSLNMCSGLEQIQNLQKIKRMYPEFKYLILVLKLMLKIRNLNETYSGGVGSYLLVCMLFHYLREFHKSTPASEVNRYSLGDYLLGFFSFYFMNVDFYRQTIEVKSGRVRSRRRKPYTLSMISPLDDSTDIGKKAHRMEDVLLIFKNRSQVIKEKCFAQGESILKELINPAMNRFEYYDMKEKFKSKQGQEAYSQEQEQPYDAQKQKLKEEPIKQQEDSHNNNDQNRFKNRRYHRVKREGYSSSNRHKENNDEDENNELSSISY